MKLAASNSNFVPAPEGTTQGVLCDIVDMGMQPDAFNEGKMVHKTRLVFQLEDRTEAGVPFTVSTFPITASINNKATLYKYIKTLLGRDLSKEDFDDDGEIDLDSLLIGKNAMVTIAHKEKNDKTYANIDSIGPIPKSIKNRLEVENYTRDQDRVKDDSTSEVAEAATASAGGKDDKIPF